jgi:hypothetical protein
MKDKGIEKFGFASGAFLSYHYKNPIAVSNLHILYFKFVP